MKTRRYTSGFLTLAGLVLASSAFAQYPSPDPSTGSTGSTGSGTTSSTTRPSTTMSANSYDVKNGTIVAVQGNQVVVKSSDGYRQLTVAPDYRFTINGQQMTMTQHKPGMTFSSTVQTTTAPVTLTTTEMNNAEVVSASGNNIVVKDSNGQQRTFSDSDFRNMGLVIMMDGRPVMASQLKTGDRVNAVMLTSSPSGTGSAGTTYGSTGVAAPSGTGTGATGSMTGTTGSSRTGTTGTTGSSSDVASSSTYQDDTSTSRRNLPKTASPWPLVGLAGLILLGIGGAVTLARRFSIG